MIAATGDGSGALLAQELRYRGHRLRDLLVVDIEWSEWHEGHLMKRTIRYPDNPDELDIEPEWATEAALDDCRLLSVTQENDLRVTGWAQEVPSASWSQRPGRVLRVVLKPRDIDAGLWSGVTAMPASQAAADNYWRRRGSFGPA